jgi:hypothetical protein
MFKIIPEGEQIFEQSQTKRVWALVYKDGFAYSSYYVEWPLHSGDLFEVSIHIILGKWGNDALPEDRFLVCVLYRGTPKPGFMIQDPDGLADKYRPLVGKVLSREAVLADLQTKKSVFELLDQIWAQDSRIKWT